MYSLYLEIKAMQIGIMQIKAVMVQRSGHGETDYISVIPGYHIRQLAIWDSWTTLVKASTGTNIEQPDKVSEEISGLSVTMRDLPYAIPCGCCVVYITSPVRLPLVSGCLKGSVCDLKAESTVEFGKAII